MKKSFLALILAAFVAPVAFADDTAAPAADAPTSTTNEGMSDTSTTHTTTKKKKVMKRGSRGNSMTKERTTQEHSEGTTETEAAPAHH